VKLEQQIGNNKMQSLNYKVGSMKNKQQSEKFEQQPTKHELNNKTQTPKCKHQSESTNN